MPIPSFDAGTCTGRNTTAIRRNGGTRRQLIEPPLRTLKVESVGRSYVIAQRELPRATQCTVDDK